MSENSTILLLLVQISPRSPVYTITTTTRYTTKSKKETAFIMSTDTPKFEVMCRICTGSFADWELADENPPPLWLQRGPTSVEHENDDASYLIYNGNRRVFGLGMRKKDM